MRSRKGHWIDSYNKGVGEISVVMAPRVCGPDNVDGRGAMHRISMANGMHGKLSGRG